MRPSTASAGARQTSQVQPVRARDRQAKYSQCRRMADKPSTASVDVRQTSVYFTGTNKTPFSHICSLIMAEWKLTIFAVETPLGWGTSHFKFELNPPGHH